MTRRFVYLVLAVIGLVVPYYFLISFIANHGFDPGGFFSQLFGTPVSTFFAVDLIISCIVFLLFLHAEGERLHIKSRWIYVVALCTVGLSFALPLFLWARESHFSINQAKQSQT